MSFHERHPGYPVRKHGEERVPLAVRVFEVCFWSLMPCAEAQGSLLLHGSVTSLPQISFLRKWKAKWDEPREGR